jgi:hypothetical protein
MSIQLSTQNNNARERTESLERERIWLFEEDWYAQMARGNPCSAPACAALRKRIEKLVKRDNKLKTRYDELQDDWDKLEVRYEDMTHDERVGIFAKKVESYYEIQDSVDLAKMKLLLDIDHKLRSEFHIHIQKIFLN